MTSPARMRRGPGLRAYLAASHAIALLAPMLLRKRRARGKEHADRWVEKMGLAMPPRPAGRLVWLHAVGLGEVLSLRGLIGLMADQRPDLSFLVTSTTAAAADVFARQMPPRTQHQFLPLDAPQYRKRFLDHTHPNLCIWAEQDLWPGFVSDMANRGIPQAIVAARMNAASYRAHQRVAGLYGDLYRAMARVTAQDSQTCAHLHALGADATVTGSLKPAAPALTHDMAEVTALRNLLANRFVWAVAPAHPADIAVAHDAHDILRRTHPDALLIIAPRFPGRFDDATWPRRSQAQLPQPQDAIWLCDTFGDLGLVYRVSRAVLIGGTFDEIEGHNPWEAAALGVGILHGPRIANFADDFAKLAAAKAAAHVTTAPELATLLTTADLAGMGAQAQVCRKAEIARTADLANGLISLMDRVK